MDERLQALIDQVCRQPEGSRERRKAMHRFLIEVQHLPGLLKSNHPDYLQALNQTWEWITRSLCSHFESRSPSLQDSLMKWINGYLYWRIKDLYIPESNKSLSLDVAINDTSSLLQQLSDTGLQSPTLDGLEQYIEQLQQQETEFLSKALKQYVQHDPEHRLRSCYPRHCAACHCQFLCQRRYLQEPPATFEELAQTLNLKLTQVTNHWYGRCKPLLQSIAQELGYGAEDE